MPMRITGMIGVTPPTGEATVHVIDGGISPAYLREFAQAHDRAGFDFALVGYTSTSAEGLAIAAHAAAHTDQLGFLIAHRPGFMAPTLAARTFATFDNLWDGRLAIHFIAGASDAELRKDGDHTTKQTRYSRAGEYIDIMKRIWTEDAPVTFSGEFYQIEKARADVRPLQDPHPRLLFGGSSQEALEMGARHCDDYAVFGEPLAAVAARMDDYRRLCTSHGRVPGFNISLRPIIAETEGAAWDKAHKILSAVELAMGGKASAGDKSGERMLSFADDKDIHDERLWMPVAAATGARGNTSCLVGTPEQVADAVLEYYKLGIDGILIRGFDPLNDTVEFGRELIPRMKAGALAHDTAHDMGHDTGIGRS